MKRFLKSFFVFVLVAVIYPAYSQVSYEWKTASSGGYTYKYVTNDPTKTRFYTLKNGLSVILSENHKEPRIVYRMVVRAGSNHDPRDHTGLAHYLEHLLFKGTDKYGTLDWAKERPYIDTIFGLYEKYNSESDTEKRKAIYKEIDRVSGEASKYAVAGEYIRMMNDIGSQRTNAHTSVEETVYEEDFPAYAIDKFLTAQAERFRNPVFRLFHTELEAVYEEKNRSLDNDGFIVSGALNAALFPTHNYGQQSTIGTIEHLKNPSLVAIRDFYNKYYVPNNMGLILAGDFNCDEVIKKVEQHFSYMQKKDFAEYNPAPEAPLTTPVQTEVFSNTNEAVRISFRTPGSSSNDAIALEMLIQVLFNQKAGLIDLNVNRQQKIISGFANLVMYKDYGVVTTGGMAKPGQTLEQVKDILLEQINKLKSGDFDESIMKSFLANKKLSFQSNVESSTFVAMGLMSSFVKNRCELWNREMSEVQTMSKLTKQDLIDVANKYFGNGYVLLYKKRGENKEKAKVDKPPITPVVTNSDKQSDFLTKFIALPVSPVKPQWIDFKTSFQKGKAGLADIMYVQNKENDRFRLHYRFDMGSLNNLQLSAIGQYFSLLGTDKMTADQVSQEFYKMACTFNINVQPGSMAINLSGLHDNFSKALALLEDLLANCQPSEQALNGVKSRMLSTRNNNKTRKETIMSGLLAYAKYGFTNPFNYVLSNEEIQLLNAGELVNLIKGLKNYKHEIIYYGPAKLEDLSKELSAVHAMPAAFIPFPPKKIFTPVKTSSNLVLFADYSMVQAEINWVRNEDNYNRSNDALIHVFNGYFGQGGSALMFQTIRESKALAYATTASWQIPFESDDPFTFTGYIGCQADKFNDAVNAMSELLNNMPLNENGLSRAKLKRKTDIETDRRDGIDNVFAFINARSQGLDFDKRKDEYESLDKITLKDIEQFQKNHLSGKPFTYCIIGQEGKIKWSDMQKLGEVKKLSLEEIFGY